MDRRLAKYLDLRVPRYTSYPTAPHFSPDVGPGDVAAWLAALAPRTELSLYLHIPFCRKMCWYCGCNMKLAARYEPIAAYVERLIREIRLVSASLPERLSVGHIHWGGGTPNTVAPADMLRINEALRDGFNIAPGAEIALELDPRTLRQETVEAMASMGATRASLGVQELSPAVQQAINRIQPFETVARAVEMLRGAGIGALNFDLLYGLPHQTVNGLLETIDKALTLRPDRIALFGYAHVPWMAKNQRLIDEAALPSPAARFEMAEAAAAGIATSGYDTIGIDHFALPTDALARAAREGRLRRNFQGYTADTADVLIGFGASSISAFPCGYAQNVFETGAYMRAVEDGRLPIAKGIRLKREDIWRREAIERLMCDFKLDLGQLARRHALAERNFLADLARLQPLIADGLVEVSGNCVIITPHGRPLARAVAAAFDAYLAKADGTRAPLHAKV